MYYYYLSRVLMSNQGMGLEKLIFHSLTGLNQPLFVVDNKGDIIYANMAASEYTGYSPQELLTKNVCEIDCYHKTYYDFAKQWEFMQTDDFNRVRYFETVHKDSFGNMIPVEVQPAFFDFEGEKFCTVLIRNIEQEKSYAEEIELLQEMINDSHDMIFVMRMSDGHIVYANNTAFSSTGYSLEEMRKIGIDGFRVPMGEDNDYIAHSKKLSQKREMVDYAKIRRKDGTLFHVEARAKVVRFRDQDYNIALVSDISDIVENEQKLKDINSRLDNIVKERTLELSESISVLESYKKAIDINSIVSKTDKYGRITYVNDIFCKVSGFSKKEALGRKHNINRHPENDDSLFRDLWGTINSKKPWKGKIKNLSKDKQTYYIDVAILPILSSDGEIIEFISVGHEITELVRQREKYRTLLLYDRLTGYGNRQKLIQDISASECEQAVGLVDIDNFNTINDFYGIEYGDEVIRQFGKFMVSMLESEFELYRLHGDQFAVRCDIQSKNDLIIKLKSSISHFAKEPFIVKGRRLTLNMTVSVSSTSKETVISTADLAKRYAKKNKYDYIEYSANLQIEKNISENMKNAAILQNAFNDNRVLLYFQPIKSIFQDSVTKYECLVRIKNEEGDILAPHQFLETAKRSRMYSRLSQIIIEKAFAAAHKHPDYFFSINITLEDILDASTRKMILDNLNSGVIGEKIIFEIVESEEIRHQAEVLDFFSEIKKTGAKIAIDDFGTGYSNFEYLIKIKADYVKIDGSLIKNIHTDKNALAIVELIISFANKMNMKTIAEFVSEKPVCDILKKLNVDYLQGYLIGKPSPDIDGNPMK